MAKVHNLLGSPQLEDYKLWLCGDKKSKSQEAHPRRVHTPIVVPGREGGEWRCHLLEPRLLPLGSLYSHHQRVSRDRLQVVSGEGGGSKPYGAG